MKIEFVSKLLSNIKFYQNVEIQGHYVLNKCMDQILYWIIKIYVLYIKTI